MKRFLSLLLVGTIAVCCFAQEKEYEVVSSDKCELDDVIGQVIGVFTLGDSLILIDVEHKWKTDLEDAIPKGIAKGVLVIGQREYELLYSVALKTGTYEPADDQLFGIYFWPDVKAGEANHALFIYKGKIRKGEETLQIVSTDDEDFSFKSIKIDNPLKERPSTNWLALTNAKANLRKGPGTSYGIIKTLEAGTMLYLDTSEEANGYYKVVYISTNQEGYVSKKLVTLEQRMPKMSSGAFKQKNTGGMNLKPQIDVTNTTSMTIKLQIGTNSFTLKAHEHRVIEVPAGTYRCICSSLSDKSISPYLSNETLKEGTTYEWSFYVDYKF